MEINITLPPFKGEFQGREISSFVFQHLLSASIFARKVRIIEEENSEKPFGEFFTEIRSYASASIMVSAAAIEANINELYISHGCPLRQKLSNFEEEFWGRGGIESISLMKKYIKALNILGKNKSFEKSREYENANILVILRNALVHFKPNWDFSPEDKKSELKALSTKFKFSHFVDDGADLISMKCMTYGCTKWAFESAIELIEKFAEISGLQNRIEKFKDRLKLDQY
jgi:hypothetical protein